MGPGREGRNGGSAHARAISAVALVAERAFAHDVSVRVGFFVRGDVASAATAVGGDWVRGGGHGFGGIFVCVCVFVVGV